MAIRDWHPGQLVVFWVGVVLSAWCITTIGDAVELATGFVWLLVVAPAPLGV